MNCFNFTCFASLKLTCFGEQFKVPPAKKPVKFLYGQVKGQAFDHQLFMDVHI
jgi:hypothetical protein